MSWFLFNGGSLSQLSPFLVDIVKNVNPPNILIVHVGADFLGRLNTIKLIGQLKQELFNIHTLFNRSLLIFSEMFPLLAWSYDSSSFLEKIRKRVNRSISKFMPLVQGFSFRHSDLEGFLPGFYMHDEVTLSPVGLDLFNLGVSSMLEEGLRFLGGTELI